MNLGNTCFFNAVMQVIRCGVVVVMVHVNATSISVFIFKCPICIPITLCNFFQNIGQSHFFIAKLNLLIAAPAFDVVLKLPSSEVGCCYSCCFILVTLYPTKSSPAGRHEVGCYWLSRCADHQTPRVPFGHADRWRKDAQSKTCLSGDKQKVHKQFIFFGRWSFDNSLKCMCYCIRRCH